MTRRPNVVLINCDDLGYGDLGCYGSDVHDTPAIDRLASEGIRLTDFYMASPVCTPSRGAMLTGCYPPRIGFDDFDGIGVLFPGMPQGLHPSEITIARLLSDAGYATQMVGKWHCGDQREFLPTRHGFDHWYGIPYSNDMGIQVDDFSPEDRRKLREAGVAIPAEGPPPLPVLLDEDVIEAQPDQAALTERYLQESVRFIREHRDEPFFLYFAHMYVHLPIYVQPRFLAESRNGPYGAAVRCIDWATDVLLHELRSLGLEDDTVVIFTSDNGAARIGDNGPLHGGKAELFEGGVRVPFIARFPGQIPEGAVSHEFLSTLELFPTLLAAAGTEPPKEVVLDGFNMMPVLKNEAKSQRNDLFFEMKRQGKRAARVGEWKWIEDQGVEYLFDLSADLAEQNNLVSRNITELDQIKKRWAAWRKEMDEAEPRGPFRNY